MRRIIRFAALILIGLTCVLAIRTSVFTSRQPVVAAAAQPALDLPEAAQHLAGAIRFRTVSSGDKTVVNASEFSRLHDYLRETFPGVHTHLQRETVAEHSLLYTWRGVEPGDGAILLAAHLDVVPVEADRRQRWTHPPFSGHIDEDFVWGRGAMDDKVAVVAILEAVERLVAEGFRPRHNIYLAFGHDEEVGGDAGAKQIAARLAERGARLRFVLDEGLVVADGVLPHLAAPVALIGIAEKGYLNVKLSVQSGGGHSSMPPANTAVGILSSAIARLESRPMAARLGEPVRQLFDYLGPEMPLLPRVVFANQWLFRPLVLRQLAAAPAMNASIRTTIAPTLLHAGVKENVLPTHAHGVVNIRILPGDSVETVLWHVRETIADDRVQIRVLDDRHIEPSGISSTESGDFVTLSRTVRQVMPDVLVAPSLVIPATDARHYESLADNVYRFLPIRARPEDLNRFHGIDERVTVDNLGECIAFYYTLLQNTVALSD